ncbi:PBPRA1643 family SWIM/SEC-C metal-binding motif protein [uncultured Ferrimonas sp.]|uniref:PBPRA1643 family SWIM/SEC-C metal-binding motif protein n=1 Tax=uncultured Ferrimonas sp. TaxID=432640 RepID=UPI00261A8EC9|nr:PBPRA1643 family SWIM/SEC-C metal-binding motif protein [uncultured Ferrimonas sp.]
MSKFFYKGKIEKKPKHESFGYNTKREAKLGSTDNPLTLQVATTERLHELTAIVAEQELVANITVVADEPEQTAELDVLINKNTTVTSEKTPGRNDPCRCGSGKKYKKCCG